MKAKTERKRLDVLLVERGLAESSHKAQAMILAGEVRDGDHVVISTEGNVLTFNGKAPQTAEIAQFEAPVPKRKLN